jgi:hypothetical protein
MRQMRNKISEFDILPKSVELQFMSAKCDWRRTEETAGIINDPHFGQRRGLFSCFAPKAKRLKKGYAFIKNGDGSAIADMIWFRPKKSHRESGLRQSACCDHANRSSSDNETIDKIGH